MVKQNGTMEEIEVEEKSFVTREQPENNFSMVESHG